MRWGVGKQIAGGKPVQAEGGTNAKLLKQGHVSSVFEKQQCPD